MMHNVDDTLHQPEQADPKKPSLGAESVDCLQKRAACFPTRLGTTDERNDHEETGEEDDDRSVARREPVSVKSTAAYHFWKSYLTDCGTGGTGSAPSPQNEEAARGQQFHPNGATSQASCLKGIKQFMAPPSVDTLLDQNIDLACFHAGEQVEQEENEGTSGTPRVSCSTEIQCGTFQRGCKLATTFNCFPNDEQVMDRPEKAKPTESEGIAVEKRFEAGQPTVSTLSSASFDPSTLTVQTLNEDFRVPELIPTPANASRRNVEPSPTFTHYTLLLQKDSADSDDIFAALSESTVGSVRDLKVPISTLSATTFLSSPSASSGGCSLVQASSKGSAAPDAGPISTKSTSSTIASSCSFGTSENAGSNQTTKNSTSQNSSLPTSTAYSFADEEICRVATQQVTDSIRVVSVNGGKVESPRLSAEEQHEEEQQEGASIHIGKLAEQSKPFESAVPEVSTDITAQETMVTAETMQETIISAVTDPSIAAASVSFLGSSSSEDDPFEWAYKVWRSKGLLSDLKSKEKRLIVVGCDFRNQEKSGQPRVVATPSLLPKKTDDSRSLPIRKTSKHQKETEDNFFSVLQQWRSKSRDPSNDELDHDLSSKGIQNIIVNVESNKPFVRPTDENSSSSIGIRPENGSMSPKRVQVSRIQGQTLSKTKSIEDSCLVSDSSPTEISKEDGKNCRATSMDEWSLSSNNSGYKRTVSSPKTNEVFSPFIPRSPSPVQLRSPSSRTLSPSSSVPSPSVISIALVKTRSSEKPPRPFSEPGKSKRPDTLVYPTSNKAAFPLQNSTPAFVNEICNESSQSENGAYTSDKGSTDMLEKLRNQKTIGRKAGDATSRPIVVRPNKKLPKSHGNFKAAVQSFLQGVENNDLELLKSFSNKSDEEEINASSNQRSDAGSEARPSKVSVEVAGERSLQQSQFEVKLVPSAGTSPYNTEVGLHLANTPCDSFVWKGRDQPGKGDESSDSSAIAKSIKLDSQSRDQRSVSQDCPPARSDCVTQPSSRKVFNTAKDDTRRSSMLSFVSPNRESTSLSLGESLVGKTIEVRSTSKATPTHRLNESTESGPWVRLLKYQSEQQQDSDDESDVPHQRVHSRKLMKGASPQAHAWRRDMAIRQVNSYDGDFSVRSSFEDSQPCQCASSVFSGQDELVEFYLPLMGMACSCGARRTGPCLRNPEEPTSLDNILRTWQTEFLASFGIYRGDQLVKAFHRSGPALAKAMRRYRRKQGLCHFPSKCCGMALSIWAKTSKAFVRSIRKQLTTGVSDGIKLPNTLYILSSFLDKIPLEGAANHRTEGIGSMPTNSLQSEECSL